MEDVERMARVCSRTTWRIQHMQATQFMKKGDHPFQGEEDAIVGTYLIFHFTRKVEKQLQFDVLTMTFLRD